MSDNPSSDNPSDVFLSDFSPGITTDMKEEYQLSQAPPEYQRLYDVLFISALIAGLALLVLLITWVTYGARHPTALVSLGVLVVASTICRRSVARRARQYPDWEQFHEKRLAPVSNPALLQRGFDLKIEKQFHSERLLSLCFAAIALTFVGLAVSTLKSHLALAIGGAAAAVCLWNYRRSKKIESVSHEIVLRATPTELFIPTAALESALAGKLAHRGEQGRRILWSDMVEWSVLAGGSDDPDMYEISLKDGSRIEVYRSRFRGREIPLLEYVRAAGVSVCLKDSLTA